MSVIHINKKVIILLAVVLVLGFVAFLLYSNLIQNHNKNQDQTNIVNEENDMLLEGYIYETKDGYGLMGWNLAGDIDFKSYTNKRVAVAGHKEGTPYTITVTEIAKMEDDSNIETQETVIYGVLKKDNEGSNESPYDRHYKVGDYDIKTDKDLSEYIDKEVAALISTVVSDKVDVKYGDLIEINIPYTIEGTLKVLSKEEGHYHYKVGEYDIHSAMNITRYDGDYLKLLVFDGQHGFKEENKVTLVKVQ